MDTNNQNYFDIIVIGGGAMGLATAWETGKRKARTLVLEQFDFLNERGSSAGVSRQFRIPYPEEYMVEMALKAIPYWEELQSFTDELLLDKVGTLWFGDPAVHSTEGNIAKAKEALDAAGVPYTNLSVEEIEKQYHFRKLPKNYIGLFQKDGASINFKATIKTLLQRCIADQNVYLKEHARVTDIIQDGELFEVVTPEGRHFSKKLVIVPGPYINDVIHLLRFHVEATYWNMSSAYFKRKDPEIQYPTWFVFQKPAGKSGNEFYGFPGVDWDHPEHIRVAPDFVMKPLDNPDERTFEPNAEELAFTSEWVENHMTGLESTPHFTSTCLVALSSIPNKELLIDFAPDYVPNHKNIVVYTTGWAAKFTPYLGKILSDLAIDGKTDIDLTPFQLGDRYFKAF